jgi:hypothetical protein
MRTDCENISSGGERVGPQAESKLLRLGDEIRQKPNKPIDMIGSGEAIQVVGMQKNFVGKQKALASKRLLQ